jgi:hypothetical protein
MLSVYHIPEEPTCEEKKFEEATTLFVGGKWQPFVFCSMNIFTQLCIHTKVCEHMQSCRRVQIYKPNCTVCKFCTEHGIKPSFAGLQISNIPHLGSYSLLIILSAEVQKDFRIHSSGY